jgi:tetratricopeptide (TPR) repeat protein
MGSDNTSCSSSKRSPMIFTPAESGFHLVQENSRFVGNPAVTPALEDHEASLLRRLFSALCLVPPDDPSIFYQTPKQSGKVIEVSDTIPPKFLLDMNRTSNGSRNEGTEVVVRLPTPNIQTTTRSAFKYPHVDAIFASTELVPADPLDFELYPFPAREEGLGSRAVVITGGKQQDVLQQEIDECIQKSKMIEFASLGDTDAAVTLLERLAVAHFALGHYNDAEMVFHQVLPAAERLHGADSVYFLSLKRDLAAVIMHLGRYPEANQLAQEVHSSALRLDKPGGRLVQRTMHVLAQSYGNLGKLGNENDLLTQLIQIKLVESGPRDANTLSAIRSLCDSMSDAERHGDSEELLRIAIQLSKGCQGLSDKRRCLLHRKLATVLFKQEKFDESEAVYRSTVQLSEQLLGASHPDTLRCKFWLSQVLRWLGRLEESHAIHLATVEKQIETRGELRPSTIESMASFSVLLAEMESMVEARRWMRRALRCSQENGLVPDGDVTRFWCDVDASYMNSGPQPQHIVLKLFDNMACEIARLAGPGSRTNDEMMEWNHKDRRGSSQQQPRT